MAKKVLSLGPKGFPREMCQETMNEMDPKNTELTLRAKSSKSLSKNPDSNTETKMMALSGTRGETDRLKNFDQTFDHDAVKDLKDTFRVSDVGETRRVFYDNR